MSRVDVPNLVFGSDGLPIDIASIAHAVALNMVDSGEIPHGGDIDPALIEAKVKAYLEAHPELISGCEWGRFDWDLFDPLPIIDPTNWREGQGAPGAKKYDLNTGALVTNTSYNTIYVWTDLLPVTPGEKFMAPAPNPSCMGYNENQEFVQKISGSSYSLTIPDGVYFIRVQWSGASGVAPGPTYYWRSGYGTYPSYSTDWTTKMPGHSFPVLKKEGIPMRGFRNYIGVNTFAECKCTVIGDSFSAPGTWQRVLWAELGLRSCKNHAVSGGRWSYTSPSAPLRFAYNQLLEAIEDGDNPDIIIAVLGTNDSNDQSVAFGEFKATSDETKFDPLTIYGGIQMFLKKAIETFPDAQIYLGSTPAGGLGTSERSEKLEEALKKCARAYGVKYLPVWEMNMSNQLVPSMVVYRNSAGDGHPSGKGQRRIGRYMTELMRATGGYVKERDVQPEPPYDT